MRKPKLKTKNLYNALHIWILVQNLGREGDIRGGGKMKYSYERDYKDNFCISSSLPQFSMYFDHILSFPSDPRRFIPLPYPSNFLFSIRKIKTNKQNQ